MDPLANAAQFVTRNLLGNDPVLASAIGLFLFLGLLLAVGSFGKSTGLLVDGAVSTIVTVAWQVTIEPEIKADVSIYVFLVLCIILVPLAALAGQRIFRTK